MKDRLLRQPCRLKHLLFPLLFFFLTACNLNAVESPATSPSLEPVQESVVTKPSPIEHKPGDPTLIFYNGTVFTFEQDRPQAQAIAIEGDRILSVGDEAEILSLQVPGTEVIDLEGYTLMPGFVDSHNHVFNEAGARGMSLEEAQTLALEHGITTMGNLYTTRDFLEEMRQFDQAGKLHIRTNLYLVYNTNCGDVIGEWYLEEGDLPIKSLDGMLRVDGVKVFSDGGTCRGVALSFELEPGGGYGDLFVTQQQLTQVIENAQSTGFQVAIHALGDRALDVVMNSIEDALDGEPNTYRHRIEHNAVIRPDQFPRYAEVGPVATIRGLYPSCEPFGEFPPAYQPWEWPTSAMLEAYPGGHIAYHSDYPYHSVNPLHHLFGFVTRHDVGKLGQVCPPYEYLAGDTISVEEGLRMMTTEAAYALFREEQVGSLRPGKAADMIILSDDPYHVDPFDLRKIDVLMTMVAGQVEWCTRTYDRLCPVLEG
jgi:predicted amidohydrolase YtcJ